MPVVVTLASAATAAVSGIIKIFGAEAAFAAITKLINLNRGDGSNDYLDVSELT